MIRSVRFLAVCALSFTAACHEAVPVQTFDVDLRGEGETVSLPELPPPFASEEIEAMVESFAWAETEELPIVDEDGRPALHYALILLRDRDNLEELNIFEIHHDALPLFDAEYGPWEAQTGIHAFPGSQYGDFAFAFLPAEAYNLFRQSGLDGEPIFDAIILRDVPEPEAALPRGSIDYDWLGEQGFVYGGTRAGDAREVEQAEEIPEGVGRIESRLLGRIFRAARRLVRAIVNGVRMAASEVRQAFGGSRTFSLRLYVHNTDTDFNTGPDELMRQAWAGERAGRPIWVRGLEVLVASSTLISLDSGETNEWGFVRFETPQARNIRVHIRLKNAAADVIGLLWDKRITVFSGGVSSDDVHINADVTDADMNVMAQMTSARDFVQEALDYESPRRIRARLPVFTRTMPTALVRTGVIAGIAPNAFTPCLGFYGFGSFSFGGGRGWSVAANVASIFDEADIWLPSDSQASRVVASHEYAHYIMCTFLADNSRRAFGRAYSEVWQDSLSMDGPTDGQAGILAEAWADFLGSQIAGGVDYVRFDTIRKFEPGAHGQVYCRPGADPTALPCLEDNIGGAPMSFPRGQQVPANWLGDPRREDIARFATILTDAFDGDGSELHNGAVWTFTRDPITNTIVDVDWRFGGHARDEDVTMPGSALHEIIDDWAATSTRLNYGSFLNAMARTMWLNGATPEEVCELFAIHSPGGMCDELIDTLLGSIAPSAPFPLEVQVFHDSVVERPRVVMTWSDLSSLASGFEATCESSDDDSHRASREVPYARRQMLEFDELPYDQRLTLSVVTTTDTQDSEPTVAEIWTPAEPARGLAGEGLPGAVLLRWDDIRAADVRVRMTSPEIRDVATVAVAEGREVLLEGLAGDVDYTFEIVSVNGAGEVSFFPSAPLTVRTLPAPELYVAMFGSDDNPLAGTRAAPFATVAMALRASDADAPIVVRIATGTYREGALTITGRTVTLEGGYEVSGETWTFNDAGRSYLQVGTMGRFPSVSNERFNTAGRDTRAGLYAENAVVVLSGLDMSARGSEGTLCVATVYGNASDVSVVRSEVHATGAGPCRIGVESIGGRLSVRESSLAAHASGSITFGSEQVALATHAMDEVNIFDSELMGVRATSSARLEGAFGWVDTGSRNLRVSRSLLAAVGGGDVNADVVVGADVAPSGVFFADNSVFNAPGGAPMGNALRVDGANANVQLIQNTASLGERYAPTSPRNGDEFATVRLEGHVRSMTLINNLLAYADWVEFPTRYAVVLDLHGLDARPLVSSSVRGNVFSYPPTNRFASQLGGGPLLMCEYRGFEFNVTASTEAELNEAERYTCQTGGTLRTSDNVALLSNPGAGVSSRRRGVVLDGFGNVVRTGTPSTGGGTMTLLRGGVPLEVPLPVTDVDVDRNGMSRSRMNPGIGAVVL